MGDGSRWVYGVMVIAMKLTRNNADDMDITQLLPLRGDQFDQGVGFPPNSHL